MKRKKKDLYPVIADYDLAEEAKTAAGASWLILLFFLSVFALLLFLFYLIFQAVS